MRLQYKDADDTLVLISEAVLIPRCWGCGVVVVERSELGASGISTCNLARFVKSSKYLDTVYGTHRIATDCTSYTMLIMLPTHRRLCEIKRTCNVNCGVLQQSTQANKSLRIKSRFTVKIYERHWDHMRRKIERLGAMLL